MATTTPNYGWTVPTSTDLVKDGATAIETLGDSVDATVKALNPETTLGDIAYRSATANTNTRLGIGTSGQVLAVSGGVPAWTTVSSGGMTTIASGSLGSAGTTLSSIAGTYKHLQLVIRNARTTVNYAFIMLRVNNDSATRYRSSTANNEINGTQNETWWQTCSDQNDVTGTGLIVIDIYDYANTTTWKLAESYSVTNDDGTPTNFNIFRWSNAYNQTGAITRLDILPLSGTFQAGTYTLYGVS